MPTHPTTTRRRVDWRKDAQCSGKNDDMFPDRNPRLIRHAKAICHGCPVATECLEAAMRAEGAVTEGHRFGVYGGLTGPERTALYKRNPGRWKSLRKSAA